MFMFDVDKYLDILLLLLLFIYQYVYTDDMREIKIPSVYYQTSHIHLYQDKKFVHIYFYVCKSQYHASIEFRFS